MILAAHQPHYCPYGGVIAKLFASDVFVVQDDVQYVSQEWQNRNRIRTANGWRWLTIPLRAAGTSARICDVVPAFSDWPLKHERVVEAHYRKSPYLRRLELFWEAARVCAGSALSKVNHETTRALLAAFEDQPKAEIVLQSHLELSAEETNSPEARLIALCKRCGCDAYLSGVGARSYLDERFFGEAGIRLLWQSFAAVPYEQLHEGWISHLSCLDLVLCVEAPLAYVLSCSSSEPVGKRR